MSSPAIKGAATEATRLGLKVLWAVDDRPHTTHAASFLRELVLPATASLTIMTVAPHALISGARPDPALIAAITHSAREQALAAALNTAQQAATSLSTAPAIDVEVTSCWGHPIDEIARAASALEADLIVLAAEPHSAVRNLALGSVTHGIVQHATCPVLIARAPIGRVDRVVVGYDGSEATREAVTFLDQLALPADASLTLVEVVEPFTVPARTPISYRQQAFAEAVEINQAHERQAEAELRAEGRVLSIGRHRFATQVVHGHAAATLNEIAQKDHADLLVIGSRRQGAHAHDALGVTADYLVSHSKSSLLIVK